ncbi:glycerol-3-phosphate 1-O-acyltransferase PlsY [Alkaliphilus hydrothermalis]|uniref:Glycerol-3-phosphate acyltransferase n=1 Tax=Alkaliphilus hydrothermalis TaxID=1482730 RepID=A0ABS2NNN8_9FIRM|nr:glycerol-3-phosphate acyltransferase PlsY [Alkaliphilus hydrothermalis]
MQQWWVILLAYLIGNFATSFIVGKLGANIDIRNHGSGNAGSTNVFRTLGLKAGIITFLGDSLKGVAAVFLGRHFGGEQLALLTGLAAIIGHNWPALLKFKGGKGIATTIGVMVVIQPLASAIVILFGSIILFRYRYVSLASVTAISLLPVILYFFEGTHYLFFGLVLAGMAIYRHRENIQRLMKGTERKISKKSR